MVYNKHCFSYSVTVFIRHAWSACNRVAVICRAGYVQQICTDPVYSLPGKNDPYFYRKRPLYLPGSEVRKRCEIFSVRSVSNAKKQISTLSVTFLQQKKRISLNNLTLGFFCGTNMSQTWEIWHICLQTFRIFAVKIQIVFYHVCLLYILYS